MPEIVQSVPPGTTVVTSVEVRGANDTLVYAAGTEALVTRTPPAPETNYLLRFPYGYQASLLRGEFEVGGVSPAKPFVLEELVIYRCVTGSRSFGLESETSDTDMRGIYLAPASMHGSLFGAPDQFEDNDAQWGVWELQKFLLLALKANPTVLEAIYSPIVEKATPIGEELLSIRQGFLSQLLYQTFNGYAVSQFKKIEQDRRNRGEVRWKHAMHLLRLLITGAAALREATIPVRVGADRERLLAVKRGELEWQEVEEWRAVLHRDFEQALRVTPLPEYPDYAAADRFLIDARRRATL